MGELTDVDAKNKTLTLKTAAGSEMKFKYDDSMKVSGSQKDAAGLATSTGRQVTINYKRDGQTNMVTSIEVHGAAGAQPTGPRSPGDRPGSPGDRPGSPDPTSPRTPGSPDSPGAPRTPGAPDSPTSPRP
jgi:YD repeat-containing protein